MPNTIPCPTCASLNKPDAANCRVCGRKLQAASESPPASPPVVLQRVMGGEVVTAVVGEAPLKTIPKAGASPVAGGPASAEAPIVDHSDIVAAAVDRIRAKATDEGQRFKPYVPPASRKPPSPQAKQEAAKYLQTAVGLFRESKFEASIEPLLKAISRDDEDRRTWILLAEIYLRLDRPYKGAVGFLRVLELNPTDDQGWLGLARVLRAVNDLPAAATVLERTTLIHPNLVDAWTERGLVLEALDNLPEAANCFARVLEIRPDHRIALEKRQELASKLAPAPPAPKPPAAAAIAAKPAPAPTVPKPAPAPPGPKPVAAAAATPVARPAQPTAPAEAAPEPDIFEEMEAAFSLEASAQAASERATARPTKPVPRAAQVRTFVEGLDETLEGGIPRGHVVLIEGAPGTMKSSLGFSIAVQNAAHAGLRCLYLSLEERASSLLKQMGSFGLRLQVPKGALVVLDPRTTKKVVGDKEDWVGGLRDAIRQIKEQRGLDIVVIDSLEALEVVAKFKDRRREIYRLFEWLRDLDVTSFVITERPDWLVAGHVLQGRWDEDFLADGVIHLRMHFVTDVTAQRRLRVVKMRGTKHETGYLAMDLDEGRFRVTRAMSS